MPEPLPYYAPENAYYAPNHTHYAFIIFDHKYKYWLLHILWWQVVVFKQCCIFNPNSTYAVALILIDG